ncbi:MAG: flippase [Anaerolineae bacterium]
MEFLDPSPDPASDQLKAAQRAPARTWNRMLRNVFALGSSQVLTMALHATAAVVVPRFLGDVNLGKLAFASVYVSYFGLFIGLGVGTYLTKEVARNPSLAAHYAVNAALMRLPLVLVVSLLAIVSVNLLGYDAVTRQAVYLLLIGMFFGSMSAVVGGTLQGLQEMRGLAVAQVAIKVFSVTAVTAVLFTGHGILEVALVRSLSGGVGFMVTLFFLIRYTGLHFSPNLAMWRPLLLGGLPFFVWSASLLTYGKIDQLMLSAMTNDAVLGWYSMAHTLIAIDTFIPAIIMMVIFPALSAAAAKRNFHSFNSIARRALQAVLLGSLPLAIGLILLSGKLIDLLYPPEFEHAVPLVIIGALGMPLVAVDMILGTALNARDKQRQWSFVAVGAAFLNPGMNAVLIPITQSAYGNGAIGASIATVVTEVYMMVMALWLLPRDVFDRSTLSNALRTVAAGLIMAAAVLLVRDLFIVVPIAVGAVVYGASCLLLRAFVLSDLWRLWLYFLERQGARAVSAG